jgi:DNA mismatch repair protein MutL
MIKLLGKTVSDKIAAGEVIERPFSVVKELVENSIDAGATSVVCEISKGGSEYIRVTDNGSGIPADEAEMAFLRHATSKIEKVEDLDALYTLGFRGEALASIAAVSRCELLTKTADSKAGLKLSLEGGKVLEKQPAGCPEGTTIVVRDLFFNTPARRKFLKSQASETAAVTDLMTKIALAYPEIKVRMISNGNVLFATRGTGERLDAIITVSGRAISGKLLPVTYENEQFSLEGYVSGPGESRANRKNQVFFVNGRVINSKVLQKGLDSAYRERMFEGRYPLAYLFLEVRPDTVDVNIHPTKQEIRFDDNEAVSEFVRQAVGEALMSREAVPEIIPGHAAGLHKEINKEYESANIKPANYSESENTVDRFEQDKQESFVDKTEKNSGFSKEPVTAEQVDIKNILSDIRADHNRVKEEQSGYKAETIAAGERMKAEKRLNFKEFEVCGVIFGTYILASFEDTFYMIDQHAAHERIFYEQLKDKLAKEQKFSQQVMVPITFDCKRDDEKWIVPLNDFGYEIDEFGPGVYIARAIPEFFDLTQAESFIYDYIDMLDDIKDFEGYELKDRLAMRACKSAVKAHDMLKSEEISRLLTDLSECENPYSCPHGRPTFIKMTKYELERRFKRT